MVTLLAQRPAPAPTQNRHQFDDSDASYLSSKIRSRYKYDKQKFGGTADENWNISLARYQRAAQEIGMSPPQNVDYIHNIFCGDAEQHYFDELEPIRDWHALTTALNDRYNGHAQQQSFADELRNLSFDDYAASEEHDGLALQKLARRIEKLVPQAPHGRKTDLDKRDTL